MNDTPPASNRPVRFRVLRHLASGLLVELEDGSRGIIRVRELSWNPEERKNWQQLYPPGWSAEAVPLKTESEGQRELSLRLAENDPWETLPGRFHKGQVVEGVVTGVVGYGAFVEFAAGLTGLLHHSQFPVWVKKNPLEVFWPGDHVRVSIQQIDLSRRRISLGLPGLSPAPTGSKEAASEKAKEEAPPSHQSALEAFLQSDRQKRHFLVVEDEAPQSQAIATWLRRLGQRVEAVSSAEAALELLGQTTPDLALVDIGLPGMNGLELAREILASWPQVRLILTTDWARAGEHWQALEELQAQGVELLIKPLLPEDLLDLLQRTRGKRLSRLAEEAASLGSLGLQVPVGAEEKRPLQDLLADCRQATGFQAAILFALDPWQRQAQMLHLSGEIPLSRAALPSLIYSPVRDIAEDGDIVQLEQYSPEHKARFRYLLEFCPGMAACLGAPVSSGSNRQHALVLLDTRPRRIAPETIAYVRATALAISALLEQQTYRERALTIQRTALAGHLTSALVHEVNNVLGNINHRLESLEEKLKILEEQEAAPAARRGQFKAVRTELAEMHRVVRATVESSRLFGRVLIKDQSEYLWVHEIIEEVLKLMRDTGKRYNVALSVTMPEKGVLIRSQAAALEHVLINLALNAIQQIHETGRREGGWVQIRVEAHCETGQPEAASRPKRLLILVEDNGPGIHASLWERVFEVGFTTRSDGSGLGLYICRSLVEAMGGRIYVAESRVLGGTTFAVELPCRF